MAMSSSVTYLYLRIDNSTVNSLCLLCPLYSIVQLLSMLRYHENQCINDAGMSKQCINVKMVVSLKCQNGAGMSKLCRYILSKWCRFRISVEEEQPHHHLHFHTTNTSLIIERSKCIIKQSEDYANS